MKHCKVLTIVLAIMMIALLVTGCGKQAGTEQTTAAPVETTAAPAETTAETTAAPAETTAAAPVYDPSQAKTVEAVKGTPVIDGQIDDVWNTANVIDVTNTPTDALPNVSKNTGKVRIMWDESFLYVLAEVKDAAPSTSGNLQGDDSVEFDIDFTNNKTATNNDTVDPANLAEFGGVFRICDPDIGQELWGFGPAWDALNANFKGKVVQVDGGYIAEGAIPWLKVTPAAGVSIGLDVQINDDSGVGSRDGVVTWNNNVTASWHLTNNMGTVTLK